MGDRKRVSGETPEAAEAARAARPPPRGPTEDMVVARPLCVALGEALVDRVVEPDRVALHEELGVTLSDVL